MSQWYENIQAKEKTQAHSGEFMLVTYLDKLSVSCIPSLYICVYGQLRNCLENQSMAWLKVCLDENWRTLMLKMRQNEANLLMWKYIFLVSKTLPFVVKKGLEATLVFLCEQANPKRFSLSQWYRHPRVLGIPIPKTLAIWASSETLTLTQIAIGNMRRGCPYH